MLLEQRGAGVIVNSEVPLGKFSASETNEDLGFLQNKEAQIGALPPEQVKPTGLFLSDSTSGL